MSFSSGFPEGTNISQGRDLTDGNWEVISLWEPWSCLRCLALVLPSSGVSFPFGKCCQCQHWEKNGFVLLAYGSTASLTSLMFCGHEKHPQPLGCTSTSRV